MLQVKWNSKDEVRKLLGVLERAVILEFCRYAIPEHTRSSKKAESLIETLISRQTAKQLRTKIKSFLSE